MAQAMRQLQGVLGFTYHGGAENTEISRRNFAIQVILALLAKILSPPSRSGY
jgi:hypothetical protein